jgi:translation initiation factor IF-1
MAISEIDRKQKANPVKCQDPTTKQIGDPRDIQNYLINSGATQHMTTRYADLEEVIKGSNLRVEVADAHIIKCPATGKIRSNMLDDNGNQLDIKLHDVMYVPGLSKHLFSITCFVHHGHHATFTKGTTILKFSPNW